MPHPAPAAEMCRSGPAIGASLAWRWLGLALIVVGVVRLVASLDHAAYRNDFAHYYLAANILADGRDPYLTPIEPYCRALGLEYDARIPTAANPPLLIRVVGLVAWLPLPAAYLAWVAVQATALATLLIAIRLLLRFEKWDATWTLYVGLILNTTCLARQFHYSQVQVIVAACLGMALLLHLRGRRAAGVAIAVFAAAFKIYPAALLPWFLLAGLRGWRDLLVRGCAGAAVAAVVLCSTGVDLWRGFVVDGLPVINRSVGGSLTNYSLPSLASLFAGELPAGVPADEVDAAARLVGKLLAGLAVGGAYFVVWRRRLRPVPAVGVLTAGMLAASLVCWSHYFVLMILPIAWLWREAAATGQRRSWQPLLLASLCLWPELDWAVPLTGGWMRLALHFYPLAALGAAAALLAGSQEGEPQADRPAASVRRRAAG